MAWCETAPAALQAVENGSGTSLSDFIANAGGVIRAAIEYPGSIGTHPL